MIPVTSSNCSTAVVEVEVAGGTLTSADTEPEPIIVSKRAAVQAKTCKSVAPLNSRTELQRLI